MYGEGIEGGRDREEGGREGGVEMRGRRKRGVIGEIERWKRKRLVSSSRAISWPAFIHNSVWLWRGKGMLSGCILFTPACPYYASLP